MDKDYKFELIPFDTETVFSEDTLEKFHPEQILEIRKEFRLGNVYNLFMREKK